MATILAASSTKYTTRQSPIRMRQSSLNPLSFLQPGGLGFVARVRILRSMRANRASSSASSSFCADGLIWIEYSATRMAALQTTGTILFVGDAPLLSAGLGDEAVPKILPERPVLFQVDYHRRLAALVVGQKLDSGHGLRLRLGTHPAYILEGRKGMPEKRVAIGEAIPAVWGRKS